MYRIVYISKCGLCAHIYNSRVFEAKPRDNRKRESYNERITHTSIAYLTYTIVTTEISKKCGLCLEKCGLCREKCGLCREKCELRDYIHNPHLLTNQIN